MRRTDQPVVDATDAASDRPALSDASDGLAKRLAALDSRHPSAPDQASRLSDHPARLTDAEHAEHVAEVTGTLDDARAEGLETDHQVTADVDGEVWSFDRRELHDAIVDHFYAEAAAAPCEGKAIIAGGLPGSGKTTVLAGHAGFDRSKYLTVNPDDIKEEMARRGMVPEVAGLSPMEASDLV